MAAPLAKRYFKRWLPLSMRLRGIYVNLSIEQPISAFSLLEHFDRLIFALIVDNVTKWVVCPQGSQDCLMLKYHVEISDSDNSKLYSGLTLKEKRGGKWMGNYHKIYIVL